MFSTVLLLLLLLLLFFTLWAFSRTLLAMRAIPEDE